MTEAVRRDSRGLSFPYLLKPDCLLPPHRGFVLFLSVYIELLWALALAVQPNMSRTMCVFQMGYCLI